MHQTQPGELPDRTPKPWWVLQTTANGEPHVCQQLATNGLECYAPEFPPGRRTRPGSVRGRRSRRVFPGYVFFRSAESTEVDDAIQWTPGVVRVLREGEGPALVPDTVVGHLRRRILEGASALRRSGFEHGEHVLIESGPLAAVDAIFDRDLGASARVRILVEMMGRSVPLDIDPADLRPPGCDQVSTPGQSLPLRRFMG